MRDEHCTFAITLGRSRCIADCHHNWEAEFEHDCTGITRSTDEAFIEDGREAQVTGGRN